MPASKEAQRPRPGRDTLPFHSMRCHWCGHTSPYHADDGCSECTCVQSWRDVVAVNVRLFTDP